MVSDRCGVRPGIYPTKEHTQVLCNDIRHRLAERGGHFVTTWPPEDITLHTAGSRGAPLARKRATGTMQREPFPRRRKVLLLCWDGEGDEMFVMAKNVLGDELEPCSFDPLTGFYRDGCCNTGPEDLGVHTVCVRVTDEFLSFSKSEGNDLSTPQPMLGFVGLQPGDRWCLCADRWREALDAGVAPPVVLEATHASTLEWVSLADLKNHAAW
jgi:uncharacterized protein (DUF2237 family)